MRKFWLENQHGDTWDLASNKLDGNACFMENPDGLGIRTQIKSFEVENTFFIEEVSTRVATISGTLHFKDYKHFQAFIDFVGNINTQAPLKLYYSVDDLSADRQDTLQKHWYKLVLVSELKKSEISRKTATLQIAAKFDCLSRWKQDIDITVEITRSGNALVMPYVYPYLYSGNNLAIDIDNTGNLPTSCVVRIEGHTDTPTFRLMQNEQIIDQAKYNIVVRDNQHLVVDSSPDTQKAILYTPTQGGQAGANAEDVYYTGEKDYTYSNFITIPSGKSTFIVSALNTNFGRCTISYSIQREVI